MFDEEYTSSYNLDDRLSERPLPPRGLLVAYSPDRPQTWVLKLGKARAVGRNTAPLHLFDQAISAVHARFEPLEEGVFVEDLGSKNGTFVGLERVTGRVLLKDGDVVRLGQTLFVFHEDISELAETSEAARWGMAGRFHSGRIASALKSGVNGLRRGLLITGPTGTGKELAARAAAEMDRRELVILNAARYTSEEEATSSLFGLRDRVFSSVDGRPGHIERAHEGALFIDEAHALTPRLQQSLLRIVEDGVFARIGDTRERAVDVLFILATNRPGPDYGLEPDLAARLRKVTLPPLTERLADIPDIFRAIFSKAVTDVGDDPVWPLKMITVDHYLSLMMDGLPRDNVRGLIDIVDTIVTDVVGRGARTEAAIDAAFCPYTDKLSAPPKPARRRSPPTKDAAALPAAVARAHRACGGNVRAIREDLKQQGLAVSRTRIAAVLDEIGLPRVKKKGLFGRQG